MRRFRLKKLKAHGTRGKETLGYTAEGIQFSDGTCVLRWLNLVTSIADIYESIEAIEFNCGHNGKTVVEWLDKDEIEEEEEEEFTKCEYCNATITKDFSWERQTPDGQKIFFCDRVCKELLGCKHKVLCFSKKLNGYACNVCSKLVTGGSYKDECEHEVLQLKNLCHPDKPDEEGYFCSECNMFTYWIKSRVG